MRCTVLVIALAFVLGGCSATWDNTANSGERICFDVFNPCTGPAAEKPVGGNTGSENRTTRGGNADARP
jgi:hypothetical protein